MWADQSVVYQIYPLGACGAPFENDFVQEHRLRKVLNWLDDIQKLNADTILFNPLFQSQTHGYNTIDYRTVDDRLGDNQDLKDVCDAIHEKKMHVLFDAVFNHVGRGFGPFQDVLKNRENSRYKDWFTIDFNGNNSFNDGLWYANWEGHDELVKLNLKNPEVVQYLLDTVDFWIDTFGVDGLRLDVAYCLDPDFLRTLHNHVKSRNPEFFLLGETLHGDYNQWCNPEMLDSVTNYECYKGLYSSFNSKNFFEILYSFNRQFGKEPWCLYTGKHLLCFVDNHDVERIASILENKALLPVIYGMLFTMPGIPAVYYGSEWGIEGKKGDRDLALRPAIDHLEHNALSDTVSRLAEIHRSNPALYNGDYQQIALSNEWCVYQRSTPDQKMWAAFNISDHPVEIDVPYQGKARALMKDETAEIHGKIPLDAGTFEIFELEQ